MLDNLENIRSIDQGNMVQNIMKMESLVSSGYKLAIDLKLSMKQDLKKIRFLGIGGSAIGGDLIANWLGGRIPGGVSVEREYHLTRPLDEDTLIICCSYSGNTIETISLLEDVMNSRSENIVLISSDGALEKISVEKSLPLIRLEKGIPPRASLPSVIGAIAAISDKAGWTRDAGSELLTAAKASTEMMRSKLSPEIPTEENIAKQLAHKMHGFLPVVISPCTIESISRRWKTQMNENAKQHCFFGIFPEIAHNELVPWLRDSRSDRMIILLLRDIEEPAGLEKDLDRFREYLSKSVRVIDIRSTGNSRIEFLLNHVLVADFTSVYSAILSKVDPSPVIEIERFKELR